MKDQDCGQSRSVVLFDLFFTLVEPRCLQGDSEHALLGLSEAQWERAVESPMLYEERATGREADPLNMMAYAVARSGLTVDADTLQELTDRRLRRFEAVLVRVEPGVCAVLETLRLGGWRLGVVSNADPIDIAAWDRSPLAGYMEAAAFSCRVGAMKPDPKIYETALRDLGAKPEQAVFVGDGGSRELEGAKALAMRTVLTEHFLHRAGAEREALLGSADACVSGIEMLPGLLEGWRT